MTNECFAHMSGCHVRDGSGICPNCKQTVGPAEIPPSKERVSDFYLESTLNSINLASALDSQLISTAFLRMLLIEIIERRAAYKPGAGLTAARISELLSKCIFHAEVGDEDSAAFYGDLAAVLGTAQPPSAAPSTVAIYDKCPFTGRSHFMDIEHPELGLVPTYGGPFDSFTIPIPDDDDERTLRSERFDHDQGAWVDGGEPLAMNVVTNEEFVDLHTLREERAAQPPGEALARIKDARLTWGMACPCVCDACIEFDRVLLPALSLTKEVKP